jgi:hypothetical protein
MRHFLHFFDFDARSKKHPCTRPCTHFQDAHIALAVTAGAFAALALARTAVWRNNVHARKHKFGKLVTRVRQPGGWPFGTKIQSFCPAESQYSV